MKKKDMYVEPIDYFPKKIRDEVLGKKPKKPAKPKTEKK